MPIRSLIIASLMALTWFPVSSAKAEAVFVRSGQNEGQGWAFSERGGCWLVTAAHVVGDNKSLLVQDQRGLEAQADALYRARDAGDDFLIAHLSGALSAQCPKANLGDRDETALLDRIKRQSDTISLFRQLSRLDDGRPGDAGIIDVEYLDRSAIEPTFTVRPKHKGDEVVQTDSGSPVVLRGGGIGEASLPLGIVTEVEGEFVRVLRMDHIRNAFASIGLAPAAKAGPADWTLAAYEGQVADTGCGPVNLVQPGPNCGWRTQRTGKGKYITLVLTATAPSASLSAVTIHFDATTPVKGVSVATTGEDWTSNNWLGDRYCAILSRMPDLVCALGPRSAKAIRLIIDADEAHILSVRIVP